MKHLIAALVIVALLSISCAHSAPLVVTGTMPSQENAGTCAAPLLLPAQGDATWRAVLSWSGPVSGADSLYRLPGAAFSFTENLPSGTYTLRCRAVRSVNSWLCDTTIVRTVSNPPWLPVVLQ